ncbi:hypothetical protein R8Z50_18915 [Longispora sp. K20-0274]|uniref:hypothetical protein n=1 Tax=Longispora sp. K20-0274 TaxID=3088255 RepID=UPI00399AF02D
MFKKIIIAALLGAASITVVGVSGASAAGDCYTAVTRPIGFQLTSEDGTVTTPTLYGSTHCNDVNVKLTSPTTVTACVIRVYQGQTDCNPSTRLGYGWQVPAGGYGIPNGAAFRVKFGDPSALYKTVSGTIAY